MKCLVLILLLLTSVHACKFGIDIDKRPAISLKNVIKMNFPHFALNECKHQCIKNEECRGFGLKGNECENYMTSSDILGYDSGYRYYTKEKCEKRNLLAENEILIIESDNWTEKQVRTLIIEIFLYIIIIILSIGIGFAGTILLFNIFDRTSTQVTIRSNDDEFYEYNY